MLKPIRKTLARTLVHLGVAVAVTLTAGVAPAAERDEGVNPRAGLVTFADFDNGAALERTKFATGPGTFTGAATEGLGALADRPPGRGGPLKGTFGPFGREATARHGKIARRSAGAEVPDWTATRIQTCISRGLSD